MFLVFFFINGFPLCLKLLLDPGLTAALLCLIMSAILQILELAWNNTGKMAVYYVSVRTDCHYCSTPAPALHRPR